MKKLLLLIFFLSVVGLAQGQNLVTENFDVFPASWTKLNTSSPAGTNLWGQATNAQLPFFAAGAGAYNGAPTSFGFVNFHSTTGANTISNWLISPVINLMNGDVISFYTIKGLSGGINVYADNMEARLSTDGATSADPAGNTGVGSYTILMHEINPSLSTTGYPTTWTQYSYTVSGLSGATDCRVAFRYIVPNGGPSGANSDQIGIDQYSVDRTLGTADFFSAHFAMYPNPVKDILNITSKNGADIEKITVTDTNGRVVRQVNITASEAVRVDVADLAGGVYFIKVQSASMTGYARFVKN